MNDVNAECTEWFVKLVAEYGNGFLGQDKADARSNVGKQMGDAGGPDLKDAMVAVMGAAVALGGLLLLFVGLLYTQAENLDPSTSDKTITRYKAAGRIGLWPFSLALLVAVAALGYWGLPSRCYAYSVCTFFALVSVATIAYGIWASGRL